MTEGDILLTVGLIMGFGLGIPAGLWLYGLLNKRGFK